jgi:hypothetical protein
MYFQRNWEFGSALSKLRNFGGWGLNPPNTPLGTPLQRQLFRKETFLPANRRVEYQLLLTSFLCGWVVTEYKPCIAYSCLSNYYALRYAVLNLLWRLLATLGQKKLPPVHLLQFTFITFICCLLNIPFHISFWQLGPTATDRWFIHVYCIL